MFICSCNVLTDRDIKGVALACDGTVVDCYRLLGVKPACGNCLKNAQELIDEVHDKQTTDRDGLLVRPKAETVST